MPSPPLRKVKPTTWMKDIHTKQYAVLQSREQQLLDLLEDIRSFSRQRADIEKSYAQSLLKLTTQFLPSAARKETEKLEGEEAEGQPETCEYKTAHQAWRTCLIENEKLAQTRLSAAEIYASQVSEKCRNLKLFKSQVVRKAMDHLQTVQAECQQTVKEMSVYHKQYSDDESAAADARNKASLAEKKLNQNETGLFTSVSTLKKSSAKNYAKAMEGAAKSTSSRNGYLLELSAVNSHTSRLHNADVPALLKVLDEGLFESISDHLKRIGQTEIDCCDSILKSYSDITTHSSQINSQHNLNVFLRANEVINQQSTFIFEPMQEDPVTGLSVDFDEGARLEKETRNWARRTAKETKQISQLQDKIQTLQESIQNNTNKPAGNPDGVELELNTLQAQLRKAEIAKTKAEARLDLLRTVNMPVDEMLSQAVVEPETADSQSLASHDSNQQSVHSFDSFTDSQPVSQTHPGIHENRTVNQTAEPAGDEYWSANVLYDYSATQKDELSLTAGETLRIDDRGAGDGWVRATNWKGESGMVPENYIEQYLDIQSAASGDNNEITERKEAYNDTVIEPAIPAQPNPNAIGYCRAVYDHEGEDDEISFTAGQTITLLSKDENGIDDGYWKGECNGQTGMFPAIVVEEIHSQELWNENHKEPIEDNTIAPDYNQPVTQVEQVIEMRNSSAPRLPVIPDTEKPSSTTKEQTLVSHPKITTDSNQPAAAPSGPIAARRTTPNKPPVNRNSKPNLNQIKELSDSDSVHSESAVSQGPPHHHRQAPKPPGQSTAAPTSIPPWECNPKNNNPTPTGSLKSLTPTGSEKEPSPYSSDRKPDLYASQPSPDIRRTAEPRRPESFPAQFYSSQPPIPDNRRTPLYQSETPERYPSYEHPENAYRPNQPHYGQNNRQYGQYEQNDRPYGGYEQPQDPNDPENRKFRNMTANHQYYLSQGVRLGDRSSSGESLEYHDKQTPITQPGRYAFDRLRSGSTPETPDIVSPMSIRDAMKVMPRGLVNPSYRVAVDMQEPVAMPRPTSRKPPTPSRAGGLPGHVRQGIVQGRKAMTEVANSSAPRELKKQKSETSV